MRKLLVTPSQSGYSVQLGTETLVAALSGGPSRQRRDFVGAVAFVNVSWTLNPAGFDYLEAFYRSETLNASEPFLIDMILDSYALAEYQVKFVPGSYSIGAVAGTTTTVNAQLEVSPRAVDAAYDEALMLLYESYGEESLGWLLSLEQLMNVEWPGLL